MAELLQLFADPDRMRPSLHRNTCVGHIRKPLLDRLRDGPKTAAIDYIAILVELAVMAPNISQVNADRQDNPELSAWDFRDEVLRRVFHGNSLSPFRKTCSCHLCLPIAISTADI